MTQLEDPKEDSKFPTGRIFILLLVSIIPIAMIVMGALFQCPSEPLISHFMIVAGGMMLLCVLVTMYLVARRSSGNPCTKISGGVLLLFFYCLVIAASGWVFGEMEHWRSGLKECHSGMYLFACVFLVIVWAVTVMVVYVKGRKFDCRHVQD